jgi:hypothetical protein
MSDGDLAYLTPEAKARVEIDRMLAAASRPRWRSSPLSPRRCGRRQMSRPDD